jgi:hypothetical protein
LGPATNAKLCLSRFASSTRDAPVTVNTNALLPPLKGETCQEFSRGAKSTNITLAMNAVHTAPAPLYRPQLGVASAGQQLPNGPSSSLNERDDPRSLRNQAYTDNSLSSPLSPSDGSDFSFSKYQNDTYTQQRNNSTTTATMGFANDYKMANSGSNSGLSPNQRSSGGSVGGTRDIVVIEHYVALKSYLTRHLAVDGTPLYLTSKLSLGGSNQRQNKAREKLIRLSKTQFNELSTDVYDELMRRQNTQSTIIRSHY